MSENRPTVSIIMPIRNEGNFVIRSLGSVLRQDYPHHLIEVLLADGMSSDATRDNVCELQARYPDVPVRILDNPKKIVPTGFNIALQHAVGAIIIRVDGHCELPPNYVSRCVELLALTGADNVGGVQKAAGGGAQERAIAYATSAPFGVGTARFRYGKKAGWADTVYLGAFPRRVFDKFGGFDEELVRNQDDEFNFRITQGGGRIWFDPSLQVTYYSRSSLARLWRQYYQYGMYKVRVIQKRGAIPSWRHLAPATFVLCLVMAGALFLISGRKVWLAPFLAYVITDAGVSLRSAGIDWEAMPLLPLTFAALHISYGLRFLAGLWRWREDGLPTPQLIGPAHNCDTQQTLANS